jgi:hypothetical protein
MASKGGKSKPDIVMASKSGKSKPDNESRAKRQKVSSKFSFLRLSSSSYGRF